MFHPADSGSDLKPLSMRLRFVILLFVVIGAWAVIQVLIFVKNPEATSPGSLVLVMMLIVIVSGLYMISRRAVILV